MKPPHSTRKSQQPKGGKSKDEDPNLSCRVCEKRGLRRNSKTRICVRCLRKLPYVAKTNSTTGLPQIVLNYTTHMIDRYGIDLSARLLEVDVTILDAIARGEDVFAPPRAKLSAPGDPSGPRIDLAEPEPIAKVADRHGELRPLSPALAKLIAPWRAPLEVEITRERPSLRQQRLSRAKYRSDITCHVPRPEAPMDRAAAQNAFGRIERIGRQRHAMPMRVCLGLWGLGFGATVIARMSVLTWWPTSKSSATRMIKQARRSFPGAHAVMARVLALDVSERPLLRPLGSSARGSRCRPS